MALKVTFGNRSALRKLEGKRLIRVDFRMDKGELTLNFDDGHALTYSMKSGPGVDSEWYDWTEIALENAGRPVVTLQD